MANQTDLRVKISADLGDIKQGLGLLRGELAKVKQAAATSTPNMGGWSSGIAKVRQELGGLVGAYVSFRAVGGIIRGVMDSFDKMDRIDEMRQMVAMSSEDLSKFAYAAQFSGVELESLGKGFFFFERNLIKNSELLKTIGVDAPTTAGKLRQLMDVFAALPDGAEKASLASALFGRSLGADIIPLLNEGTQKFDELSDAAARTGNVFSDEATASAAKFKDNLDTLKATLTGVFNVTAQQLAPSMAAYAGAANAAGQESNAAAEGGKFLATVFKVVAVGGVIVKNVIEAVVGVLGFLVDGAIESGKIIITSLGGAFKTVGATMKAFLTGGPLAAFTTFTAQVKQNAGAVMGAQRSAQNQMRGSWAAMRDGFKDASSDIANAFVGAMAEVPAAEESAKKAVGGIGDAADAATAKGEALRKMLAALFAEGGKDGKAKDKAKEAVKGLADQGALALDQVDRDLDLLEQRYADGQVKLADYFTQRQALELQQVDIKLAEAQADALSAKSTDEQSRALTEIIKLQRDRAAIGPKTARDQAKAEQEATAATLENLSAKYGQITGGLSATEGSISAQMSAGAIGYAEGERRLQQARQATLDQLAKLRSDQDAYIATLQPGDPKLAGAVQGLLDINTAMANIGASMDRFGQDVEAGALTSLQNLFRSIREEGGLTIDALKSAVADFAASIYDSITGEWAKSLASNVRGAFGNLLGGATEGGAEAATATAAATIQTTAAATAAATLTTGATAASAAIVTGAATGGGTLAAAGTAMAAAMVAGATAAAAILQTQATVGSITGAFTGPSAKGNVFGSSGMHAFAKGAAFTNRLFSVPTFFQFGQGGQFGVMGEAGTEAVMPLTRGPGGRLGVDAHGAGRTSRKPDSYILAVGDAQVANAMAGADGENVVLMHVRNNWEAINGG